MPDPTTCRIVCRQRHPLEWIAREPRVEACDDCRHLVELVLDAALGRV